MVIKVSKLFCHFYIFIVSGASCDLCLSPCGAVYGSTFCIKPAFKVKETLQRTVKIDRESETPTKRSEGEKQINTYNSSDDKGFIGKI